MCQAYFGAAGTIWITGLAAADGSQRKLQTSGTTEFLIDTGSALTLLSPLDANRIGIDVSLLKESAQEVSGFGGTCHPLELGPGRVGLVDEYLTSGVRFHLEKLDCIYVLPATCADLPSILGLDLLERFDLTTDRAHRIAHLRRVGGPGNRSILVKGLPPSRRGP